MTHDVDEPDVPLRWTDLVLVLSCAAILIGVGLAFGWLFPLQQCA